MVAATDFKLGREIDYVHSLWQQVVSKRVTLTH